MMQTKNWIVPTLMVSGLLIGCAGNIEYNTTRADAHGAPVVETMAHDMAQSGAAISRELRLQVRQDLTERLPLALNATLMEGAPDRVLMLAEVKASLDQRLADSFSRSLLDYPAP